MTEYREVEPGSYLAFKLNKDLAIEDAIVSTIGTYRDKTNTMPKVAKINERYKTNGFNFDDLGVEVYYVFNIQPGDIYLGPQ